MKQAIKKGNTLVFSGVGKNLNLTPARVFFFFCMSWLFTQHNRSQRFILIKPPCMTSLGLFPSSKRSLRTWACRRRARWQTTWKMWRDKQQHLILFFVYLYMSAVPIKALLFTVEFLFNVASCGFSPQFKRDITAFRCIKPVNCVI